MFNCRLNGDHLYGNWLGITNRGPDVDTRLYKVEMTKPGMQLYIKFFICYSRLKA